MSAPLTPKQCCTAIAVILRNKQATLNWGAGSFPQFFCAIKRVVLIGALQVLWKDNVSTNYVADCLRPICCPFAIRVWEKTTNPSDLILWSTKKIDML